MVARIYIALLVGLVIGCSPVVVAGAPPIEPESWSFVVLPDTQVYARYFPEIFQAQTDWIAAERDRRNIRFVLHEGDIVTVAQNDFEWQVASNAFAALSSDLPYVLAIGNHEYIYGSRSTPIHSWFPFVESADPSVLGTFDGQRDNAFFELETPDGPMRVLTLEFGPRDKVVLWANDILNLHSDAPVILLTHAYLFGDGSRYDWTQPGEQRLTNPHGYDLGTSTDDINDGEELWNDLVRRHSNIRFVLSGHVHGDGAARRISTRDDGSVVHEIVANYQADDLGGGGFLRLFVFRTGSSGFRVFTYSPYYDAMRVDTVNQFALAD